MSKSDQQSTSSRQAMLIEIRISHMIAAYRALPEMVQQITLDGILVVQCPWNWKAE